MSIIPISEISNHFELIAILFFFIIQYFEGTKYKLKNLKNTAILISARIIGFIVHLPNKKFCPEFIKKMYN